MKIIDTIKDNIDNIKSNFETKLIDALREQNEEIIMNIERSNNYKGNSVFVFVPDRAPDGKVHFTRSSKIITYEISSGLQSIFASKDLDHKVWDDIGLDPFTFEGQVFRFGLGDLFPKMLWDSRAGASYTSNIEAQMVLPFRFESKRRGGLTLKTF